MADLDDVFADWAETELGVKGHHAVYVGRREFEASRDLHKRSIGQIAEERLGFLEERDQSSGPIPVKGDEFPENTFPEDFFDYF